MSGSIQELDPAKRLAGKIYEFHAIQVVLGNERPALTKELQEAYDSLPKDEIRTALGDLALVPLSRTYGETWIGRRVE